MFITIGRFAVDKFVFGGQFLARQLQARNLVCYVYLALKMPVGIRSLKIEIYIILTA